MSEYSNGPITWDQFHEIIMAAEKYCLLLQDANVGALLGQAHGRQNAFGTRVAPVPNALIKLIKLSLVQHHYHGPVYCN